jgi:hypothetical protein
VSRLRLPRQAPQRSLPTAPPGFDRGAIEELLHDAVLDVLDGSPPGPLFATRVQRVCIEALRRAGIRGSVTTEHGGQHVIVWVPVGKRVERVVVSIEAR